jgi:hypothetical protein
VSADFDYDDEDVLTSTAFGLLELLSQTSLPPHCALLVQDPQWPSGRQTVPPSDA